MNSTLFFNPEDAAKSIFQNSFLKGRGMNNANKIESKREAGMGSKDFQSNRIRSCSYVSNRGNDVLRAVPFYDKRQSETFPSKSLFAKSWNSEIYSNKSICYAGMGSKKPLMPVI